MPHRIEAYGKGESGPRTPCLSRRDFLFAGSAVLTLSALGIPAITGAGGSVEAVEVADHRRRRIGRISELNLHTPVIFLYPYDHPHCSSMLVKLGVQAGGGVGAEHDIVAFNQLCAHQGGLLEGQYQAGHHVLGPCPIHLTTYDLTRYGMVVSGHATQGLPQVRLETDGDDIFATGVMGLIFGFHDNRLREREG